MGGSVSVERRRPAEPAVPGSARRQSASGDALSGPVDVSIIVPNYNARRRLRACLRSVYALPPAVRFEVLAIDDASSDYSAAMVRQEFPEARLLVNEANRGYAASCNRAVAESRGRYVYLVNNDVELLPGAVDTLARFLDGRSDKAAAGSVLYNSDGTIQASVKARPSLRSAIFGARSWIARWFPENRFTRRELLHWMAEGGEPFTADYVSSASLMLSRQDYDHVGGLDPGLTYFVDADLCQRLRDAGRSIYCVPAARASHHAHQGGTLVSFRRRFRSVVEFHVGAYRYFCRYGGAGPWHPLRGAVTAALALRFVPSVTLWLASEMKRAILPPPRADRPEPETAARRSPVDEEPVDVSVVIANYKAPDALARCLRSIFESRWSCSLEVLVVDDASRDGTSEMVRAAFPRVVFFQNYENLGYARSCNRAIASARGRFIYLLNNDAELLAGAIDELVEFLETHPEAGAAGSLIYNDDGTVQATVKALPSFRSALFGARSMLSQLFPNNRFTRRELLHWRADRNEAFTAGYVSGSSMMVPRTEFQRVGELERDLFYFNDADYCKRLWRAGREVYYVPRARVIHRAHQGGSMVSLSQRLRSFVNFHVGAYRYFRKHGGKPAWHPMHWVVVGGVAVRFCLASPLHLLHEIRLAARRLGGVDSSAGPPIDARPPPQP